MKLVSARPFPALLAISFVFAQLAATAQHVGIGTDNPNSKLHIKHDANAETGLAIENTHSGPLSGQRLLFVNGEGPQAGIVMSNLLSPIGNSMTLFNNRATGHFRFNTGGTTKLYLGNNGHIGIGNNFTTPGGLLHLQGAEWNTRPMILESTGASSVGPSLRFTGHARTYDIIGATGPGSATGAGYFAIWDNDATAYRLVVSPSGSIGIGTATPMNEYRLHVSTADNAYVGYFQSTYLGNTHHTALYAQSENNPGYGYGIRARGGYMGGYFQGSAPGFNGTIYGLYSVASGVGNIGTHYGVYATANGGATNYAGYFAGNVHVQGTLTKGAGTFKIDHPQDPANKYLSHSFVESPDMMNIYTGTITTNSSGEAIAQLPAYFEALNIQFTYQLTVIGQFAQAIVSSEIAGNQFSIKTDKPHVKVSWLVTGVRNDPYARDHRVVPEQQKAAGEQGKYLYPAGYNQPADKALNPAPPPPAEN